MVKLCQAERVAQKARRKAEEKAWKDAERQRVAEEEERKRRTIEYLQWLQDKVLEEETALLEGAEGFQVMGSKCKKVTARDKEGQQPSKKARGKQPEKYRGGATAKMGGTNPCERCVSTRQDLSRSLMMDFIFYFLFLLYCSFLFLLFYFLFLEQLRLGFISHAVTSVTS